MTIYDAFPEFNPNYKPNFGGTDEQAKREFEEYFVPHNNKKDMLKEEKKEPLTTQAEEKPITKITKNASEEIRFTPRIFKGHKLLDIRVWFQNDEGKFLPTKKGICFSVEKLKEFREAVELVEAKLNQKQLF